MVKPLRTDKFELETGHDFAGWVKFLDAASARELSHKDIAAKIESVPGVSSWWTQSIAVAYEQHIGRRRPGQKSDGTFSAGLSRTFASDARAAFKLWAELMDTERKIAGRRLSAAPTASETPSAFNWRRKLDDGSRVAICFAAPKPGKTQAALQHDGLSAPEAIDSAKAYWTKIADKLAARLAAPPEQRGVSADQARPR